MLVMKFEEGYYITPSNLPNKGILLWIMQPIIVVGIWDMQLSAIARMEIFLLFILIVLMMVEVIRQWDGWNINVPEILEKAWEPPMIYTYSKQYFQLGINTSVMAEKAVVTNDGTIVIFHLLCDISENPLWEPYRVPTYSRSFDQGLTWSKAEELIRIAGAYMMQYIYGKRNFCFEIL